MLSGSTDCLANFSPAVILIASWKEILNRIWHFLDDPRTIGNIPFSITTLIAGALIFGVAWLLSRTVSAFLRRRIAKRAYLDPGLSYTLGRLVQYLIITL